MKADERFANPVGIIQGGFLAAFADSSMGAASVTYAAAQERKVFSANAEIKVSFLRPAPADGRDLTCTAYVISGGKRAAFITHVVRPGVLLSVQTMPRVRSQLGGTWTRWSVGAMGRR